MAGLFSISFGDRELNLALAAGVNQHQRRRAEAGQALRLMAGWAYSILAPASRTIFSHSG
jgi:hypothetical protein